jgi:hypothetical protein
MTAATNEPNARQQEPVIRNFRAVISRRTVVGFPVDHGLTEIGGAASSAEEFRELCRAFLDSLNDHDVYSVTVAG